MRLISDDAWAIMLLWGEARGESYEGKLAVARVVRNRMRLKYFSDGTVAGTILRPYQFSMFNTSDHNRIDAAVIDTTDVSVIECRQAWEESESKDAGIGDAVLYYNPAYVQADPPWATPAKRVAKIGAHVFYLR